MSRTKFLVTAAAFAALVAGPATLQAAIVAPAGLLPGEWYYLAFVTSGTTKGTSLDIANYDSFVRAQASLNPELGPFAANFQAVASTFLLLQQGDEEWDFTDYPVFNTQGEQLNVTPDLHSPGYGFLEETTTWLNPLAYDQFGEASHTMGTRVWTGFVWNSIPYYGLGALPINSSSGFGTLGSLNGAQFSAGFESNSKLHPLYGYGAFRVPFDAGGGVTEVGGASTNFSGQLLSTGTFASTFYEPSTTEQLGQTLAALNAGQSTFILPGAPAQIWDLDFTGAFTGSATVTLSYNPASVTVGPSLLRIRHWTGEAWETPANQVVDPVAHTITFDTDSFSPFLLTVVPEPSSLVMAGLGVALLAVVSRRRLKRA